MAGNVASRPSPELPRWTRRYWLAASAEERHALSVPHRDLNELPRALLDMVVQYVGHGVEYAPARGGFSRGIVGRVVGENSAAFVKALPLTDPIAADYQYEAQVTRALPPGVASPHLILSDECDGWVTLLFEFVDGRAPTEPWSADDLAPALRAWRTANELLSPAPDLPAVTVGERMAGRDDGWRLFANRGEAHGVSSSALSSWEREHLDELAGLESEWVAAASGPSLLHFNLRHDNFLIRPDGTAVIVDWGRACLGAAWVDPVVMALESDLPEPAAELLSSVVDLPPPKQLGAVLAMLAGYWAWSSKGPPAGELQRRREASHARTLAWLRARSAKL